MHHSHIVCTTLALLASVSAVPTPGDLDGFVLDEGASWPRADDKKPRQLVYCPEWWADMEDQSGCQRVEGNIDDGNRDAKPECTNLINITPKSSISPGKGLNCTLFARPDCKWGPEKNPKKIPFWLLAVRYWGVKMEFTYPGRGNFADANWIDSGIDGNEFVGKLPKSIECTPWRKNKQW